MDKNNGEFSLLDNDKYLGAKNAKTLLDKAKTKHGIASKNSKITLKNTNITNAKEFGLYSYNCSGKITGGKIANCGKYGIGAYKKGISYSKVKFSNNGANGKSNYYRG